MKYLHKENNRGKVNMWWTKTAHSFSFWEYYNSEMMWFWALRVLNDDTLPASEWIWMHPHNNMEIITIPLAGSIFHSDSMWNKTEIKTGEVQAMSAWTGILHSEINPSDTIEVELFQIWIETREKNIQPQYNQKQFLETHRNNKFQLLVSPDQNKESVFINQDTYFSRIKLTDNKQIEYKKYNSKNWVYFMVINWSAEILWEELSYRDAIWIVDEDNISLQVLWESVDILVIEVPMN
jgi:redox-sensitive bicupin YhaK (pirin superfamily)